MQSFKEDKDRGKYRNENAYVYEAGLQNNSSLKIYGSIGSYSFILFFLLLYSLLKQFLFI